MPKQIFQRPAPINHQKVGKNGGSPFGQPDWGRKKAPKLPQTAKKAAPKSKQKSS